MGRDARRNKQGLGGLDNRGDVDRAEIILVALLNRLRMDKRIGGQYHAWCHRRELPRLMTAPVSDAVPDLRDAAMANLMTAVTRAPSDEDRRVMRQALEAIGPGHPWPRSVIGELLVGHIFPAIFYTAIQRPDLTRDLYLGVWDDGRIMVSYGQSPVTRGPWVMVRRGHRPRQRNCESLAESLELWYQAYLQDPPVPRPVLAQDYARREQRHTDPHSAITDRLELVEWLLSLIREA
jgi:hypothetical protein